MNLLLYLLTIYPSNFPSVTAHNGNQKANTAEWMLSALLPVAADKERTTIFYHFEGTQKTIHATGQAALCSYTHIEKTTSPLKRQQCGKANRLGPG